MGISSDGQLTYGIYFEDDFEFPWDDYDSIEEWWCDENGLSEKSYKEREAFLDKNLPPIEMSMHCAYEYPMYIMTTPFVEEYGNSRGDATEINAKDMLDVEGIKGEKARNTIRDFCKKYKIENDFYFSWWLTSLYG